MAIRPKTCRKLMVQKLTTDFRAAVTIETVDMCQPKEGEICVRNKYVGINASDVNISKGRYFSDGKVPFDVGFEGVGEVVNVGKGVTTYKEGDAVGYLGRKSYAEYTCIPAAETFKIPEAKPEYLVLLVSGLTAAIGLDKNVRIVNGETVLITAAAGGTGHIAVQWAKASDCHVIGTCSSEEKVKVLKDLGCDRVINYKKEDIGEVLAKEYPKGIDAIWETIGGEVFQTCLRNIAVRGRLVVVGGISGYKNETNTVMPRGDMSGIPEMLLFRSAAIQGFLLMHYQECYKTYFQYLMENVESGKLKALYDFGKDKDMTGLEGIIDGVEYLHSGKSVGKVIVKMY